MRKIALLLALLLIIGPQFSCSNAQDVEDRVIKDYDEKEMDAAIAKAKKEVDTFINKLSDKSCSGFAVKAPIKDENGTEFFWLSKVKYKDGSFTGVIDNDPGIVKNVKNGQEWTIKKEDIADWLYMKNKKMYGNHTLKPLLPSMSPQEAAFMKSIMAEE